MRLRDVRKVALGTGSAIKIDAVREALGPSVEVVPVVDAPSGVSSQPIGREETERGALNRAAFALARVPDADAGIGIENGMWPMAAPTAHGKDEDGACIAVRGRDGAILRIWSDVLPIPFDRPFPPGKEGEWSALKDPHVVLTNGARPRKDFLRAALEAHLRGEDGTKM